MVADLTRSIDELRHRRVQLRKRIVLLTGAMPPGPPDDCRRQAEMLKAELRGTEGEWRSLQDVQRAARQMRRIDHYLSPPWRNRR